jgi:hypothetical protein
MTRPRTDVEPVFALRAHGMATARIARTTGIPRSTIRYWLAQGPGYAERTEHRCDPCAHITAMPAGPYAYLLGLYLGDGCLSEMHRGVYRLRITLDKKYPGIIDECCRAMALVLPNKVGKIDRPGCFEVYSDSKHWSCLFPKHGRGPKHQRPIVLSPWQHEIAMRQFPYLLLRGLIQSDGWRGTNRIAGRYEYPRYLFSNRSADIRALFKEACWRMDIESRQSGQWQVAVSRRHDVARMDIIVGEKR